MKRPASPSRKSSNGSHAAPPALPPLGSVMDFLRLIWAIDHRVQSVSKRMVRTVGVSGPQRFVLRIVGQFPGIAAGQVARIMHLHPATLTSTIGRLEQRGLVQRRADAVDRRRALLGLTPSGRKLDVATPGTVEAAVGEALATFPPEVVEHAREVLAAIEGALAGSERG